MSSEWRECSLGDLITIKHGFAFSGEQISKNQGKCVLVTPGNFEIGGGFKEGNAKYFHGEYTQEYIFASGDLIVTMTDLSKTADTLGYSAKIPGENGKIYLHNQRVGKVCSKSTEAELDYLFWVMRHRDYRSWVVNTATGSTVKHTSPSRILEYSFQLPPLGEQKAIAHILGTLDDKIELNRKTNETLEAMAKALFQSWFVDFDPVRAKAAGRPTGLPDEISDLFPDSFEEPELGEIPRGWRVAELGDISEWRSGSTPSKTNPEYWGGTIPWISASSMKDTFAISSDLSLTEAGISNGGKLAPKGAILLLVRGSGLHSRISCCLASTEMAFNQDVKAISAKTESILSTSHIFTYLQARASELLEMVELTGIGAGKLDTDRLQGLPIAVPSPQLVKRSQEFLDTSYERIKNNLTCSIRLCAIRDTLLPKLISGELRIPEAQKLLEQAGV